MTPKQVIVKQIIKFPAFGKSVSHINMVRKLHHFTSTNIQIIPRCCPGESEYSAAASFAAEVY